MEKKTKPIKFDIEKSLGFCESFLYQNENEKEGIIQSIAETVSDLYSYFLTPEARSEEEIERLRKMGIWFDKFQSESSSPPKENIELFRSLMKLTIHNELIHGKYNSVQLETDYSPNGILEEIMNKAGISRKSFEKDFHSLLPYKTFSCFYVDESKKQINVSIHLKGPVI